MSYRMETCFGRKEKELKGLSTDSLFRFADRLEELIEGFHDEENILQVIYGPPPGWCTKKGPRFPGA